jgi:hypothetical protein
MLWRGGCIFDDGNFETLLEQFAQMRFDAHVGEHPTKNDIADLAFAELKNKVIGLWPEHAMRRNDDGSAIVDLGLETLQQVSAGAFRAIQI